MIFAFANFTRESGNGPISVAGEHVALSFVFYQDAAATLPVNVTGWSAIWTLTNKRTGAELARVTSAGGGLTNGGIAGTFIGGSATQSPAINPNVFVAGTHEYALEIRNAANGIELSQRGDAEILSDLTP